MAGKTSQVGGVVVRTLAYAVLAGGTLVSLIMGLLFGLISSGAGLAVGIAFGVVTLLIALPMLFGGKKLEHKGEAERDKQRVQAVLALAANRGGILRASDVAGSLQMPLEGADTFLTELAKTRADEMDIDVNDAGEVVYKFPRLFFVGASGWSGKQASSERVRVAEPKTEQAAPRPPAEPQVIDADFEEIDDPRQKARSRL
jgi:hypothetical protein